MNSNLFINKSLTNNDRDRMDKLIWAAIVSNPTDLVIANRCDNPGHILSSAPFFGIALAFSEQFNLPLADCMEAIEKHYRVIMKN